MIQDNFDAVEFWTKAHKISSSYNEKKKEMIDNFDGMGDKGSCLVRVFLKDSSLNNKQHILNLPLMSKQYESVDLSRLRREGLTTLTTMTTMTTSKSTDR
jgi:hypothetical protein